MSATKPTGSAIIRYPRGASTLNSKEMMAIAPNTDNVATHTRRYSSAPAPMTLGDRVRCTDKSSSQLSATMTETIV